MVLVLVVVIVGSSTSASYPVRRGPSTGGTDHLPSAADGLRAQWIQGQQLGNDGQNAGKNKLVLIGYIWECILIYLISTSLARFC